VDRSYRLGLRIVLATILGSAVACLGNALRGAAGTAPAGVPSTGTGRAGEDLAFPLGAFRLTERSGRTVDSADLAGRVWVASFVFTRCPLSCPRITSTMKGLQSKLEGTGVQLVSISVDPDRDSPAVLADYARRFGADDDSWWFLTGDKDEIVRLVVRGFKLGLVTSSDADVDAGAEPITHSDRLALVDRGNVVVALYDSNDPAKLVALAADAGRRSRQGDVPAWARRLPAVNASLNGLCTVLLVVGWWLIRGGNVRGHAAAMIAAVATSAVFLACYLLYHALAGSKSFAHPGPIRVVYLTILLSHTLLATFGVVPLVAMTLTHAARRRFDRHARIARVTFPIWLYVSATGVVIYLLLYQLPVPAGTSTGADLVGPRAASARMPAQSQSTSRRT
jgi:protein SCO1/2